MSPALHFRSPTSLTLGVTTFFTASAGKKCIEMFMKSLYSIFSKHTFFHNMDFRLIKWVSKTDRFKFTTETLQLNKVEQP